MLDEKKNVLRNRAADPIPRDMPLQLQRLGVGHSAEGYGP
jgi:hypothetical protein